MPVLKGTTNFYDYDGSDILAENLRSFYHYGLLEAGAYTNINVNNNTSGYSILQRVNDDRYIDGQIYEGMGPHWIWQNDISPTTVLTSPFQVSGVYVNQNFYPLSTSGVYKHSIDYARGRVIFASGLTPQHTDLVQCEYSFSDVAVYLADSPQWRTIVSEYVSQYNTLGTLAPSGMAAILKQNRVWLPAIFIDVQNRTNTGLQLGGGELAEYAVFYHIFSDRPFTNKKLAEILNNQETITLNLFNVNTIPTTFNYDGTLTGSGITFLNLNRKTSPYFWTFGHILSSKGGARDNLVDLYLSNIIQQVEVERTMSTY